MRILNIIFALMISLPIVSYAATSNTDICDQLPGNWQGQEVYGYPDKATVIFPSCYVNIKITSFEVTPISSSKGQYNVSFNGHETANTCNDLNSIQQLLDTTHALLICHGGSLVLNSREG